MVKQSAARAPETPHQATYQDILDAPPHMVAELINGTLHMNPRPTPRHGEASTGLMAHVSPPFHFSIGGPGGWIIHAEPELHLVDDVLVPDIAGWRRERLPQLPSEAFFSISPDWVCEILSPSTRTLDLGLKRTIYGAENVQYLWLVDPECRTLEAFVLKDRQWSLVATLTGDTLVSLPPFEEISFNLTALWGGIHEEK